METEIKCPKCSNLMQEGFLLDRGADNFTFQGTWVQDKAEESFWLGLNIKNKKKINVKVFRCPKCSFLEFYAPE